MKFKQIGTSRSSTPIAPQRSQRGMRFAIANIALSATMITSLATAGETPASFALQRLLPALGGDGTEGVVLRGIDEDSLTGVVVASAGDVNGDGIDDAIMGSWAGTNLEGEVYVVFGSDGGFPATLELSSLMTDAGGDGSGGFAITTDLPFHLLGWSVAGAGDINGDGVDDIAIGAISDFFGVGTVYVIFGRDTGFPAEFDTAQLYPDGGGDGSEGFVILAAEAGTALGRATAFVGDVDDDNLDDLVITADPDIRETYVIKGRTDGFPAVLDVGDLLPEAGGDGSVGFVLTGVGPAEFSDRSVGSAGDLNADGVTDLIIGADNESVSGANREGRSYVVFGRSEGFPAAFDVGSLLAVNGGDGSDGFVLNGIDEGDRSGSAVAGAGDLNDDGVDDIIISAPGGDANGLVDAGENYVIFGRSSGFPAELELRDLLPALGGDGTDGFVIKGPTAGEETGLAMNPLGDINGDGVDDVLLGSFNRDPFGRARAGETFIVFGRADGFPGSVDLISLYPAVGGDGSEGTVIRGIDESDFSGGSVSAGDFNGDGRVDVLIGANGADPGGRESAGEVYLVFGQCP